MNVLDLSALASIPDILQTTERSAAEPYSRKALMQTHISDWAESQHLPRYIHPWEWALFSVAPGKMNLIEILVYICAGYLKQFQHLLGNKEKTNVGWCVHGNEYTKPKVLLCSRREAMICSLWPLESGGNTGNWVTQWNILVGKCILLYSCLSCYILEIWLLSSTFHSSHSQIPFYWINFLYRKSSSLRGKQIASMLNKTWLIR